MQQLIYYKMRQKFITKCLRFFITKCNSCYKLRQFYYKMRQLLQNATFITNCDSTNTSASTLIRGTVIIYLTISMPIFPFLSANDMKYRRTLN